MPAEVAVDGRRLKPEPCMGLQQLTEKLEEKTLILGIIIFVGSDLSRCSRR
jgi:hypothetical protein